jgi:2-polyprenyl-3-methyl-5-hydroxy-6-metoxy-1,4-benzoquinol methylase
MKRNEATLQNWNQLAQAYQDKFMEMDVYNATYDQFCEVIEKDNARILELGCGPANITNYILNKKPNYTILATDTSPNMIQLGKINVPKAEFQLLDVRDIATLNQKFDAILCGFVLPYLTKEETEKFILDSAELLNQEGVLYFSCIEKEQAFSETQTSSDGKFQMQVHYHEASYLLQALEANHFKTLYVHRISYPKPNGTTDIHLVIIAQQKS